MINIYINDTNILHELVSSTAANVFKQSMKVIVFIIIKSNISLCNIVVSHMTWNTWMFLLFFMSIG
jgi:hypothetical protein